MLSCFNSDFVISCSLALFSHIKGSLIISVHLSSKIILVDPNLVLTFFGIKLLILIMVRTLENNYFLVRTKLGYLRYGLYALVS